MKEARAGAAELLRDFDVHDAQAEQLVDQRYRDPRAFVHLAADRADFAIGELIHAVAEEAFVLGQGGQRGLGHGPAMLTQLRSKIGK